MLVFHLAECLLPAVPVFYPGWGSWSPMMQGSERKIWRYVQCTVHICVWCGLVFFCKLTCSVKISRCLAKTLSCSFSWFFSNLEALLLATWETVSFSSSFRAFKWSLQLYSSSLPSSSWESSSYSKAQSSTGLRSSNTVKRSDLSSTI